MSLISALGSVRTYKPKQGRITRQVTFGALAISIAMGCWQLSSLWSSEGTTETDAPNAMAYVGFRYLIPGLLCALGVWFSFRLVHYPPFSDFLIAVEAEMSKVSWPTRRELFRASMVVLVTMVVLALVLFFFDALWKFIFYDVLNIANQPPKKP